MHVYPDLTSLVAINRYPVGCGFGKLEGKYLDLPIFHISKIGDFTQVFGTDLTFFLATRNSFESNLPKLKELKNELADLNK